MVVAVFPSRNLPLVPHRGHSLLIHQKSCCFPLPPPSGQSERSLSDLQVRSDHLTRLDKPLGLQIAGEPGAASASMPTSWKLSLPALLTDQLTGTRDLSLESLPGGSLPDSLSSGTLQRVPTLQSPVQFPQSSLRIVPRAGPGARYSEGIIKSLQDDRHTCCPSLFYELCSQKGRIHGARKWLRCQAQPSFSWMYVLHFPLPLPISP